MTVRTLAVVACLGPVAADWPQFRDLAASGVADPQTPPVTIGPDQSVEWKVACPPGFLSPIVVGDLLVLTAFEGGKLFTVAYDRGTGAEKWRADAPAQKIEAYHKTEGSPAASTPASDSPGRGRQNPTRPHRDQAVRLSVTPPGS